MTMRLRTTHLLDHDTATAWIEADPAHRGKIAPEFFVPLKRHTERGVAENFVLEGDYEQGPLLFFRLERVLRVHIQFPPVATKATKRALVTGLAWLERRAARAGYLQIVFESGSPTLRRFAVRRLGFRESGQELVKNVSVAENQER